MVNSIEGFFQVQEENSINHTFVNIKRPFISYIK